jgi:uncharacterized membrane protein/ketosteroid isomerase-like protein
MESLIEPNFHPILVHFAYALTTAGALSLFAVSIFPPGGWRDTLKTAGDWMLALGAVAIVATIAAGFQAYYSVGHDTPSHAAMTTHRNWAVPTGAALLVLAGWRYFERGRRPTLLFSAPLLAAAGLLTVTAWWGGELVYNCGLGVKSLPQVSGEGHDHEHPPGQGHGGGNGDSQVEAAPNGRADGASHDHGDEDMRVQVDNASHEHAEGAAHDHGQSETGAGRTTAASTTTPVSGDAYPQSPDGVAEAFARALRAGDEAAIRALVDANVVIAEGGGAERSLAEYSGHHMPSDMAFSEAMESTMNKRDVLAVEDMAAVITESQIHGSFRGENVHSRMIETMVMTRANGRWRITHIHWSSAPITGEHAH